MAKQFKCWKKDNTTIKGRDGKRFVSRDNNFIISSGLSQALSENVCLIDKEKSSKCKLVKDNETVEQAVLNFVKANDKC